MPLPDERPRQSVANLIGRFEQQTKRSTLSSSTSTPQRLFSVSTHNTGESAGKEEKREWPPASIAKEPSKTDVVTALEAAPSIVRKESNGPVVSPPVSTEKDSLTTSLSAPAQVSAVTEEPEAIVEPPKPALVTPPESPPTKPITSPRLSKQSTTHNASNHPRTSAAPSASARSLSKATAASVPKAAATPTKSQPAAKPLKPQHTGQSTTSNTSTVRAKSRAGVSAPSTPSRNANSTPSRPKTPSSGLYAPTAASLAKARGAQPPMPTPTRKSTNAAAVKDVMERLSKPTAASASKTRAPTTASTTTSPAKTRPVGTAAKGVPAAKTVVKPKTTAAPTTSAVAKAKALKEKSGKVTTAKVAGAAAGAGAVATATSVAAPEPEPVAETKPSEEVVEAEAPAPSEEPQPAEDVHETASQPAEEIENYDDDFLDDTVIHDRVHGISDEVRALEAEKSVGEMFANSEAEPEEKGEDVKEETVEGNEEQADEKVDEKEDNAVEKPEDAAVPASTDDVEVTVESAEPDATTQPTTEEIDAGAESDVNPASVDAGMEAEPEPDTTEEVESPPKPSMADSGDDLVNLVKMLERPPTKAASDISSIPDLEHAGVIPDDEEEL